MKDDRRVTLFKRRMRRVEASTLRRRRKNKKKRAMTKKKRKDSEVALHRSKRMRAIIESMKKKVHRRVTHITLTLLCLIMK